MSLANSFVDAMDISSSCFVFASAGSGKTRILVERFIKHMVLGCRPEDIMCVTFTRAAAFEMETRIEDQLKKFAEWDEVQLTQYLKESYLHDLAKNSFEKYLKRAKNLYSEWMDNYTNLNIVTIHSFCQKLLEQYPIEAGVMPDFDILDDLECEELLEAAKKNFWQKTMRTSDTSVNDLAALISNYSFEDLLDKVFSSFPKFRRFIIKNPDIDEYSKKLNRIFKVGRQQDIFFNGLQEDMFLTKTGEIRKKIKIAGISDSETRQIAETFYENRSNRNKEKTISKTIAFIKIATHVLEEYQYLKKEKNALDFTDIIHKAEHLLTKSVASDFVMSQISKSIKHIMIDEAQDLNSDQWGIISLIFNEVFVNASDDNTIFVVGDIKQSIYGFQDAKPDDFISFYERCKDVLPNVNKILKTVYLKTCYRCAPAILTLVDKTCSSMPQYEPHIPFRSDHGIATLITVENIDEEIPIFIKNLKDVSPNDIIVLTKNRGAVCDLIKNIYDANIQTSGFDKVNLNDSVIIMDIIALAEICINQSNDYAFVCALKSPNIFDKPLDDIEIYNICHNRKGHVYDIIKSEYMHYADVIENIIMRFNTYDLLEFFYYLSTEIMKYYTLNERDIIASFIDIVTKRYEKYNDSVAEFVIWFKTHNIQFQKDHNKDDGVKFSTIHGSKGLEAPVVMLVDFALSPDKSKVKFVWSDANDMLFVIKPIEKESFEEITPMTEACYFAEKMENFRLLYVAMTRARDSLYLFGPIVKATDGVFSFIYEKMYVN